MSERFSLPENFNPETKMLVHETETGRYHQSREAARLAANLLAGGTPEDIALAEEVLLSTLACQELNSHDPHYGNFYWMAEDTVVADLNAVEFVLEALIPMMLRHGERLSEPIHGQVLRAISRGLAEIARLDVLVAYSNITGLDVLNTCLGGELLGDQRIAERGYAKLRTWIAFTAASGHPMEYNSPTYTAVTLRALALLAELVRDDDTRIRARAFAARLALSAALHIHTGTGRWAGPHSRAYHPSVVGETPPEEERLRGWLADGTIPEWIGAVLNGRPQTFSVAETAEASRGLGFSTFHSPGYALGVAASSFQPQANVCIAQVERPGQERPGVLYTRYVLDDKWFGDFYHATDRSQQRNLLDEGRFFGVQEQNRAIGIYAPQNFSSGRSAKAAFVWTDAQQIDQLWIGQQRQDPSTAAFSVTVPPGETVVVGTGRGWFALRILHQTALGRATPVHLLARAGDLVLEAFNYRGEEKNFWEMRWPGAFWQGHPLCVFYLEMAERDAYPSGDAFAQAVAEGTFAQENEPPFTYAAQGMRRYQASYSRGGQTLGLEIDRMAWRLLRRWTSDGALGWPQLQAEEAGGRAFARQNSAGRVEAAGASVVANAGEAPALGLWLWGNEASGQWVAGHFSETPVDLKLSTPGGAVEVEQMGMGTLAWMDGQARVEATGNPQVGKIED